MTSVFAADDSVLMTSIATSTTCRLECRIGREDCPGLPETQPWLFPRHEIVHATVDLDVVDSMPSGNTLHPVSHASLFLTYHFLNFLQPYLNSSMFHLSAAV